MKYKEGRRLGAHTMRTTKSHPNGRTFVRPKGCNHLHQALSYYLKALVLQGEMAYLTLQEGPFCSAKAPIYKKIPCALSDDISILSDARILLRFLKPLIP